LLAGMSLLNPILFRLFMFPSSLSLAKAAPFHALNLKQNNYDAFIISLHPQPQAKQTGP